MVSEVGETLDEIVVDFFAGRGFADYEGLASQIAEGDFHVVGMRVMQRQHREDAFRPKVLALAIRPAREPSQERNVELTLPHGGDVFSGITIGKAQLHRFVALPEGLEEVSQKARGQRRKDADSNFAIFPAADRRHFRSRHPDLRQCLSTALNELPACLGELHATCRSREQGGAKPIFQITNSAADS